jgi:hypothetical protein
MYRLKTSSSTKTITTHRRMFLVKSFIFKCGLACRHPAVCLLLNLVQPLPARYTKRKSLASRYISGLQAREGVDLATGVPDGILKASPLKKLDQGIAAPLQDLGSYPKAPWPPAVPATRARISSKSAAPYVRAPPRSRQIASGLGGFRADQPFQPVELRRCHRYP